VVFGSPAFSVSGMAHVYSNPTKAAITVLLPAMSAAPFAIVA
jgi:hypothetical protein